MRERLVELRDRMQTASRNSAIEMKAYPDTSRAGIWAEVSSIILRQAAGEIDEILKDFPATEDNT